MAFTKYWPAGAKQAMDLHMGTHQVTKPDATSIVWFEIPADNIERTKGFYEALFGWKMERFPGPMEYWHVDTGGGEEAPDGGLMQRQDPNQGIINYIGVSSVAQFAAKVVKLGGRISVPKTAVPQMGYFAVCEDPEHNVFGLWERNPSAK